MSDLDPEIVELARAEATECLTRIEHGLLAIETGEAGADALDALFRDAHTLKGGAAMVGWTEAAQIAHGMEDRLDEARAAGALPPELADPLLHATDFVRRAIDGETGVAEPALAELRADPSGEAGEPASPEPDRAPSPAPAPAARPAEPEGDPGRTVRVEAGKVDRLLDAVGESTLHHRRLEYMLSGHAIGDAAEQELDLGGRLIEEFQGAAIELRAHPLDSIMAPFPRAVRDLARAAGKEARIEMAGTETQLDRTILDGLAEIIGHLLRNSIAHGIESPEERERAGKPRAGTLMLSAEPRAGMVAVTLADDGRGVSPELLERARAAGSLADVLAQPGVSTAEEVSDVAGRGVGLDAVREHVESLGGGLEVTSEPGAGTAVTMLMPLTLTLLDALICERGGQAFALPVSSIEEVVAVEATTTLGGRTTIDLRGEPVPLRDLAQMIGGPPAALPQEPAAVVVSLAGRKVAVAFDRALGDQEIVIRSLGPLLAAVPGYIGAAVLGDGGVALVLDPAYLVKLPSRAPAGPVEAPAEETRPAAVRRVMIVDDQLPIRELQRSILETAGYGVTTAAGGEQALELLAGGEHDLLITDIEMPGMDGFELLGRVRDDDALRSLPVVVVTGRDAEVDRRRGLEAGADAYIAKSEFDQRELLGAIERLIGR